MRSRKGGKLRREKDGASEEDGRRAKRSQQDAGTHGKSGGDDHTPQRVQAHAASVEQRADGSDCWNPKQAAEALIGIAAGRHWRALRLRQIAKRAAVSGCPSGPRLS
jgi:hypothetical protein